MFKSSVVKTSTLFFVGPLNVESMRKFADSNPGGLVGKMFVVIVECSLLDVVDSVLLIRPDLHAAVGRCLRGDLLFCLVEHCCNYLDKIDNCQGSMS